MFKISYLIKKTNKINHKTFIKLINEKKAQMYKTALLQLGNSHDAMDAVSDTILTAYEKILTLKKPEYFSTWIIRILLNKCHDIQRHRNKVVPIENLYDNKEKFCSISMENIEMQEALDSLNVIYKTVIDLRYNQDMKIDQIAEILDIPSGTVKSRLNKALKLLKKEYAEKEV